jgi:lipid-A-disaccharide synthase-like uncharacterized protein
LKPNTRAAYEVGDDFSVRGPLLDPFRYATYTPFPHSAADKLKYLLRSAKANWPGLYLLLASPAYGSPFLLLFVFMGLFSELWDGDRLAREFVLLTMALSVVVLLASAHHLENRYSYPFVPIAIIWSGKGLLALEQWFTRMFLQFLKLPRAAIAYLPRTFAFLLLVMLLVAAYPERNDDFSFVTESSATLAVKKAGEWLRGSIPPNTILAAMNSRLAYYGRGIFVQFPLASPETTLRYLESKKVQYIALESSYEKSVPTIGLWMSQGISDPHVKEVY